MNFLQQFQSIFNKPNRGVARLVVKNLDGSWEARTSGGNAPIRLSGVGYEVGQTVFYDIKTRKILENAPNLTNLTVVELRV